MVRLLCDLIFNLFTCADMTWGGLDLYPLSGAGFRSEIAIFILKKLEPVKMDPSRRTECLEGTRTDILDFV